MWLSKLIGVATPTGLISAALLFTSLSGCTVEPLNASRPDSSAASLSATGSTASILASTSVDAVKDRVAQQVRNNLLFAMNGGRLQPNGKYRVNLRVVSRTRTLSIENSSLSPTSAKVIIVGHYNLIDKKSGKVVASGKRQTFAGFDRTPQSFANERAERDAQNRAAKVVAQEIRVALAQTIAGL